MKSFKELILFFSVVLISSFGIKAQEVISTQGASYFNAYVKWDFTIGETVIFTGSSSNNVITQGFHQPLKAFYVDIDGDGFISKQELKQYLIDSEMIIENEMVELLM